MAFQVLSW